jgi:hypothetical protein
MRVEMQRAQDAGQTFGLVLHRLGREHASGLIHSSWGECQVPPDGMLRGPARWDLSPSTHSSSGRPDGSTRLFGVRAVRVSSLAWSLGRDRARVGALRLPRGLLRRPGGSPIEQNPAVGQRFLISSLTSWASRSATVSARPSSRQPASCAFGRRRRVSAAGPRVPAAKAPSLTLRR